MPAPGTPEPDPYVDAADPIALRPETYARHAAVVNSIEGANRARYPYPRRGRTTSANAGIWGQVASGDTISACSGLTLGSGNVTLCSRNDINLNPDGDVVKVYNAGDAITGPKSVKLSWSDGDWAVSRCN